MSQTRRLAAIRAADIAGYSRPDGGGRGRHVTAPEGGGIVEDIITELSRFRARLVIARNSTFTYKGKAVDVKQVGRELGVRYVVEGSIRKAGDRVRVTAQLIDAATGNYLWAERYDRTLEDVFAVQEEVTRNIVAAVAPQVELAEIAHAPRQLE